MVMAYRDILQGWGPCTVAKSDLQQGGGLFCGYFRTSCLRL